METILDSGHTWYLECLSYDGALEVGVVEGLRSQKTEDLKIGDHVIKDLHRLDVSTESRRVVVRFAGLVAWQCLNESFSAFDKAETRDTDGFAQVLSKSAYLDYVTTNHGWYADIIGPASHYRVWTEDEVIDVIATEPPVITPGPCV